jgi:hypothetical protein
MTPKKPTKPSAIAEKKGPEITKKRGGARPNTGGKRPGAGRPPGVPNKVTASVREAAQVFSDEAVNTLADIMKNDKAPAIARIAASNAILDRAHGRPHQSVEVAGGPMVAADPAALIALSEAMDRSRMERRAIMEKRRQMGFLGD